MSASTPEDLEALTCHARGLVLRAPITDPANYRAQSHLGRWLEQQGLVGIAGIDTRRLTRRLRDAGAQTAALGFDPDRGPDIDRLTALARAWPGLVGMDLASEVSCRQRYHWTESVWHYPEGYRQLDQSRHHVVAVDYGIKRNILRSLASLGRARDGGPGDHACGRHPGAGAGRHLPLERPGRSRRDRQDSPCRRSRRCWRRASRSSASASATRCSRWRSAPPPRR